MAESIEQRVQRLEDHEAITRTWCDYLFALDSLNWDKLAEVFTEDGAVEMVGLDSHQPGQDRTYRGRKSLIEDFYAPVMSATAAPQEGEFYTGHHGCNMKIELLGDEATTLAYFFEILGNTQMLVGTYQHRMRREPDRWRIAYLRISIRYRAQVSATESAGCRCRRSCRCRASSRLGRDLAVDTHGPQHGLPASRQVGGGVNSGARQRRSPRSLAQTPLSSAGLLHPHRAADSRTASGRLRGTADRTGEGVHQLRHQRIRWIIVFVEDTMTRYLRCREMAILANGWTSELKLHYPASRQRCVTRISGGPSHGLAIEGAGTVAIWVASPSLESAEESVHGQRIHRSRRRQPIGAGSIAIGVSGCERRGRGDQLHHADYNGACRWTSQIGAGDLAVPAVRRRWPADWAVRQDESTALHAAGWWGHRLRGAGSHAESLYGRCDLHAIAMLDAAGDVWVQTLTTARCITAMA